MLQSDFMPAERELVMMFSRKVEKNARLVELFNKGLKKLKKDGRYEQFFVESRRGDYVIKGE